MSWGLIAHGQESFLLCFARRKDRLVVGGQFGSWAMCVGSVVALPLSVQIRDMCVITRMELANCEPVYKHER